jgi:exopolysaccharide production protein ExoQ
MIFSKSQRATIVILLILLGVGAGLYPQANDLAAGEHLIVKLGRVLSYILVPLLILEQWKRFFYVATRNASLLVLIGITLASFLWSDSPASTIDNGKGLIRTTLLGMYLATQYNIKEQMRLFAKAIAVAAPISLIVALALPVYGIMNPIDDQTLGWRGIFFHKNDLGDVMAIGITIFFLLSHEKLRHKWLFWVVICLMIALLILANAKTPLIGLLTSLSLLPFHKMLRQQYTLKAFLLTISIILVGSSVVWISNNTEALLIAIGKDPGLNGRADTWTIIIRMIQERPWLGYGYFGFWSNPDNAAEVHKYYISSWKPGHAHNGLLTLLLDVGLVGGFVFLYNFFFTFKQSIFFARSSKSSHGIFPLQVLTFLVVGNISGNVILVPYGSISWLLYTTIVVSLSIHRERALRMEATQQVKPVLTTR